MPYSTLVFKRWPENAFSDILLPIFLVDIFGQASALCKQLLYLSVGPSHLLQLCFVFIMLILFGQTGARMYATLVSERWPEMRFCDILFRYFYWYFRQNH